MERRARRQDQVDLQASPRREIPRRVRVQRRCRGVERREGAQAGRAAFRPEPGRRHRLAHAEPAQRAQDRQDDGRADDGGAGRAAADQSHQPVHGEPGALEEALRRGAGERHRSEGARQAGVGRLRPQCLGHRPVEDGPVRPARAARTGEERRLLGRQARSEGRSAGAAADAGGRTPAPRRCCPARSTGSRTRRPTRCRRSSSAAS